MAYVMLIDDDEDFSSAAATVLRASGHEVEVVLDTKSAVARMEERAPDIVVLDVMFPEDRDAGFDLARRIKRHEGELRNIPILMLTAVNQAAPIKFSERDIDDTWLPVSDFLEKPVDLDVLRNRVNSLIGSVKSRSDAT